MSPWFSKSTGPRRRPELQALHDVLRGEGLSLQWQDGGAGLMADDLLLTVDETPAGESTLPGLCAVTLRVTLSAPGQPDTAVTELTSGFGPTQEDAVVDAVSTWSRRVLTPVLAARGGRRLSAGVEVLAPGHEHGLRGRHVYLSQPQLRPDSDELMSRLRRHRPLFGAVHGLLADLPDDGRRHWVGLFFSRSGWDCTADCRLDNRDWQPGTDALLAADLGQTPEVFVAWQFAVIEPSSGPTRAGAATGASETPGRTATGETATATGVSPREQVLVAMAAMRVWAEEDNRTVADELARRGWARDQADLAVALVSLAFGRVLLARAGIRFRDEYVLARERTRREETRPLSGEPWFRMAVAVARAELAANVDKTGILAVVRRSDEFRTTHGAVRNGAPPESLGRDPPVVRIRG